MLADTYYPGWTATADYMAATIHRRAVRPAVFLDRDGVLDRPFVTAEGERPPWSLDELAIVPEAPAALARLRAGGFVLVVVTNQPDVGRGQLARAVADAINERVRTTLGLDAVYTCFHSGHDPCSCRKPAPGLVITAAADLGLDLATSWLVGDRWVDVAAGQAAGVATILVERRGSWSPTAAGAPPPGIAPTAVAGGIGEAATIILGRSDLTPRSVPGEGAPCGPRSSS
ncbi:MAG TPA: HAD family hydrolase [Acidimicrobiales bacterium]